MFLTDYEIGNLVKKKASFRWQLFRIAKFSQFHRYD